MMNSLYNASLLSNAKKSIASASGAVVPVIPSGSIRSGLAPVSVARLNSAAAAASRQGIVSGSFAPPVITEVSPPSMPAPEGHWYDDKTKLAIAGGSIVALLVAVYFANKSRGHF